MGRGAVGGGGGMPDGRPAGNGGGGPGSSSTGLLYLSSELRGGGLDREPDLEGGICVGVFTGAIGSGAGLTGGTGLRVNGGGGGTLRGGGPGTFAGPTSAPSSLTPSPRTSPRGSRPLSEGNKIDCDQ